MLSIEEGAGKMKAAVEARQDPKFVIAGPDQRLYHLRRRRLHRAGELMKAAGVDMIFLAGVKSNEQIKLSLQK